VNTSKYDSETRKQLKLFQRTSGYQTMKQEHLAARALLEKKLRESNETIDRLKKKLVETGISADEVNKLAA
jgi:hypothetical protein